MRTREQAIQLANEWLDDCETEIDADIVIRALLALLDSEPDPDFITDRDPGDESRAPVDPPVCLCDPAGTYAAYDCPRHGDQSLVDPPERVSTSALREALEEITEHSPGEHHGSFSSYECGICDAMLEIARRALEDTEGEARTDED